MSRIHVFELKNTRQSDLLEMAIQKWNIDHPEERIEILHHTAFPTKKEL